MNLAAFSEQPLPGLNQNTLHRLGLGVNAFFRLSQVVSLTGMGILLKHWCGLTFQGQEKLVSLKQCLLAPTHYSHLDFWAVLEGLPKALRRTTYVAAAKDHFYDNLLWTFFVKLGSYHNFPFERTSLTTGNYRRLMTMVNAGCSLLMFPQGTRSRDNSIKPFKAMLAMLAIECQVPIVPVFIRGTWEALPPDHFFIKPHPIEVCFGDPLIPQPLPPDARRGMPQKARALNQQLMASIEQMANRRNSRLAT